MLFKTPKTAMCRRCDVPLVATFAFDQFEFYCLDCGGKYGFLQPKPADETPELVAECDRRLAEFTENASALIPGHKMKFATEAEIEAHQSAMQWLSERAATPNPTKKDGGDDA